MYLFHCSLICELVYFYDDVSGSFYPFVNKIELSRIFDSVRTSWSRWWRPIRESTQQPTSCSS